MVGSNRRHSDQMSPEHTAREVALRKLPLAYSLALRLRDTGIDDDLLCDYLRIEPDALAALLETAQAKFTTALIQATTNCACHAGDSPPAPGKGSSTSRASGPRARRA